ncbi:MAG: hypothetical protein AAF333_05840 [Planctomycetota bacterium]
MTQDTPEEPDATRNVSANEAFEPLRPERLTWALLLGRWVSFARSAVALPTDGEGGRMRDAVPEIIGLQAVWFALEQLDELPGDERALGLDRARVLIDRHAGVVRRLWAGQALPAELDELIGDAERAWENATVGGGEA